MKELHETYGDRVAFFLVYIREAHALDGHSPLGGEGMPIVEDPITLGERFAIASTCVQDLGLDSIPALIDDMDDSANLAYEALPDRLYLIGQDGNVAYKGGPGPFGFDPDELESAIKKALD